MGTRDEISERGVDTLSSDDKGVQYPERKTSLDILLRRPTRRRDDSIISWNVLTRNLFYIGQLRPS